MEPTRHTVGYYPDTAARGSSRNVSPARHMFKAHVDCSFSPACSRRAFLEKALLGAAAAATAQSTARPINAAVLSPAAARAPSELADLEVHEAAALVQQRKVSPVELTQACLARIEALDSTLNAFITVTADSALAEARQAEAEVRRGMWRGPLHGIPVALKDLIDTAGVRTTAASALFKDRLPREDAVIVRRLRDNGAVLLGKLNMYEVAFGPTTKATSFFGRVSNPWATDRISGGSSSGAGAAVAAGLCFAAVGSDTGGSIRQPAAFCGVVGLMPSYGRVSTRGTMPLSRSADYLGPMTRSVVDAAIVLRAIAGYDPGEVTSYDMPVQDYAAALSRPRAPRMRVGVARDYFFESLDPQVSRIVDRAVSVFAKLGAEIHDVTLPESSGRTVIQVEAYSYHAASMAATPELYLPETLSKLRLGANIDMAAYIDAKLSLEQVRRSAPSIFRDVDAVLTPTTPVPPPKVSELPSTFDEIMANDAVLWRNTRPFNLLALPTISIPCGFTDLGMPVGFQLSAAPWQELQLLKIAHAYEQATNWNTRRPAITTGRA
jgi:aspartyl-tRNA(Asn)/glutamyl-tRNA(Gln) amidotransferase subunit A